MSSAEFLQDSQARTNMMQTTGNDNHVIDHNQELGAGDKLTRTGTNDSIAFLKYVAADSSRRQTVTSNVASA